MEKLCPYYLPDDWRLQKIPKRYSVLSSAPSNVRVTSILPWILSAKSGELTSSDCMQLFGYLVSFSVTHWESKPIANNLHKIIPEVGCKVIQLFLGIVGYRRYY